MRSQFLLAALLIAGPACATDDDLLSVAAMRGHARVLLVFAPSLDDQRLETQRGAMARFGAGGAQRDLQFVQVAADKVIGARDDAGKLRRQHHVAPGDYRTLLIGKDGNVAVSEAEPLPEARLAAAIDAMPMRKAEVARAKAGLGKAPAN